MSDDTTATRDGALHALRNAQGALSGAAEQLEVLAGLFKAIRCTVLPDEASRSVAQAGEYLATDWSNLLDSQQEKLATLLRRRE